MWLVSEWYPPRKTQTRMAMYVASSFPFLSFPRRDGWEYGFVDVVIPPIAPLLIAKQVLSRISSFGGVQWSPRRRYRPNEWHRGLRGVEME